MWVMGLGLGIPLLGTALGAAMACALGQDRRAVAWLSGGAAGVMLAAAVWSLMTPALAYSPGWAAVGFAAGMLVLRLPQRLLTGHRTGVILLAVVLHNIPEGMAVGAALAGTEGFAALRLAFGVALQNLPDGAVAVVPLLAAGMDRRQALGWGLLTGAVEPLAALAVLALAPAVGGGMGLFLGFAAGAMLYVVAEELLPGMSGFAPWALFAAGFLLLALLEQQ